MDALEKLATHDVNLILTDLNMPYMDGIELIKTIKSTPSLNHLPVLMVTTENDDVEREKAYTAGADGYLVKPVTASTVKENIKKILKTILTAGKEA